MNKEVWREAKGYEGLYEVSNRCRVRSLSKKNYHYIMPQRIDRADYLTVRLTKGKKNATVFVHRLVAFAFIPNPNNKPVINHKSGNKTQNDIDNLEWVTHSENMKHAYKMGLSKVPGENKRKVIDDCTKKEYDSIADAAKSLGIPYSTCKNYLNGKRPNPTCLRYFEKKAA